MLFSVSFQILFRSIASSMMLAINSKFGIKYQLSMGKVWILHKNFFLISIFSTFFWQLPSWNIKVALVCYYQAIVLHFFYHTCQAIFDPLCLFRSTHLWNFQFQNSDQVTKFRSRDRYFRIFILVYFIITIFFCKGNQWMQISANSFP